MNRFLQWIRASGDCQGSWTGWVPVAGILLVGSSAVCSAAFSENFQDDTAGATPSPFWAIVGTNGTTTTANVGVEGTNQFLALRDMDDGLNLSLARTDSPITTTRETWGYLQFDVRFNQGINSGFTIKLKASKPGFCVSCLEPVTLSWFHNANNTNQPLFFTSRGNGAGFGMADPNANAAVTNNFAIGSWQTIRVDFTSGSGDPRGTYTVSLNGNVVNYLYLNQGDAFGANKAPLALDEMTFASGGTTTSIDIDNIQFIPEPSAAMLLVGGLILWRRRR